MLITIIIIINNVPAFNGAYVQSKWKQNFQSLNLETLPERRPRDELFAILDTFQHAAGQGPPLSVSLSI